MTSDIIPEEIKEFVSRHVDSVAHLEGLILLRNNHKTVWSVEALAKRLYIDERQTTEIVHRLYSDGFLIMKSTKPLQYQYQPSSQELSNMVDRVADIYVKYLVPVTNLIHSKPVSRVQEFADAFKLTKEE
jgi:hypothetical protein